MEKHSLHSAFNFPERRLRVTFGHLMDPDGSSITYEARSVILIRREIGKGEASAQTHQQK